MNKTEQKKLLEEYQQKYLLYCSFASELHNLLEKVLKLYGISTAHIESRAKSVESLKGKLQRKGKKYKTTLSEITDLAGIRIVVYSLDDIDEVAEKIPADLYVNIQGDEPLLEPETIKAAIKPFYSNPELKISNLI